MLRLALAALLCTAPEEPTVHLVVGEERIVTVPDVQRIAGGTEGYDVKALGNNRLLLVGYSVGRHNDVLVWSKTGARVAIPIEVDPPRPERFTQLKPEEATRIPLAGVTSVVSSDPKAVTAEATDAGYSLKANALGGSDVRVETRDGQRVLHHVRVRKQR